MRIGIDFDNTIVGYDGAFHAVALERGLIPADLPRSKLHVRDHLRSEGREELWTEMQGVVYGARMDQSELFEGVAAFLRSVRTRDFDVAIVSHKTRVPFRGPAYDLHASARAWLSKRLRDADGPLVAGEQVFFEPTKAAKLDRIGALACDFFIDDLPEVLLDPKFPARTRPILFDPEAHHDGVQHGVTRLRSWAEIARHIEAACATSR